MRTIKVNIESNKDNFKAALERAEAICQLGKIKRYLTTAAIVSLIFAVSFILGVISQQ